MIYKQLELLCTQHGTTPTAFVRDVLKLSSSKVTAWKNGSIPKIEILQQIAEYFGVSVGYLFDGKEKSSPSELSEEERELLVKFGRLDNDDKQRLLAIADSLFSVYPAEKKENA